MSSLELKNLIYLSPYYAVYSDKLVELQPGGDLDRVKELTKIEIQSGPYFDIENSLPYWRISVSDDQRL